MHRAGLLASVVLGGFGSIGAALAADMPVKAPVAAPHFVHNWSGVYIGGHAGYGIGASDFLDSLFAFETKGFLAGGQIGHQPAVGQRRARYRGRRVVGAHQG